MTTLPHVFVIQVSSGSPYLGLLPNPPANMPSGLMRAEENQIWSPHVKFAAEALETGDSTLVHIRCCYNNKYWVVREIQRLVWVVAAAAKPEEDRTKPECTLFRYAASSGSNFRLESISRPSRYVHHVGGAGGGLMLSHVGAFLPTRNWESLVILPAQVSFKSEVLDESNYLCSRVIDKRFNYHRFETEMDVVDPVVAHELFPTADGNYRIRNLHFRKFWRLSPTWIWADAEQNNTSNETLFSFTKVSPNHIAIRNLRNNLFCAPDTREGKVDCLRAEHQSLIRLTWLMVHERVLERTIRNVRYRLTDSRIYQEELQEVSNAFATNDSATNEATITLNYSTTESTTTSWNNTVSISVGMSVSFEVNFVPFIAKGQVEITSEYSYSHEWGGQKTTENKRETSYAVTVPPLTTMKVTLLCTKATCDVPFSYEQRDLLPNGQWIPTVKDDGIYTGINSYNFYFQSAKV